MEHVFANFTSPKSRIALQVARKIAPCDRALRLDANLYNSNYQQAFMLISCCIQVFAWEIADQLLIKKQSTTSCFIGAQTMRTKVSGG